MGRESKTEEIYLPDLKKKVLSPSAYAKYKGSQSIKLQVGTGIFQTDIFFLNPPPSNPQNIIRAVLFFSKKFFETPNFSR